MAFLLLNLAFLFSAASAVLLPSPTGPYGVGVTQHILNKTTPNDPTAPNNGTGTFILVSTYYPTAHKTTHRQPYFDPISATLWENKWGFPNGSLQTLETELQPNAPFLKTTECDHLPTLIFAPGGGENSFMYYLTTANLVSHGYTLVTFDHPGDAPALRLPNGETVRGAFDWDGDLPSATVQGVYDYRVQDIKAVITDFPRHANSVSAHANTTHYIAFGHSIGGAASAGAARAMDSVMASLNYDGQFFAPYTDTHKPLLLMQSINHTDSNDASFPLVLREQKTAWYEAVSMYASTHSDYTDECSWLEVLGVDVRSLKYPYDVQACGAIGSQRAHEIIAEYTKTFFRFVVGGAEGVLGGPSLEWHEVVYLHGSFFKSVFVDPYA